MSRIPDDLSAATRFNFSGIWPPEAKAAVSEAFLPLEPLLPHWCRSVSLQWSDDAGDEGDAMRTMVRFEYRNAVITVLSGWLTEPPEYRLGIARHEIAHIYVNPLVDFANQIIERLLDGDDCKVFREWVQSEHRHQMEGVTEDIAILLTDAVLGGTATMRISQLGSGALERVPAKLAAAGRKRAKR